jgi:hypothetical protein
LSRFFVVAHIDRQEFNRSGKSGDPREREKQDDKIAHWHDPDKIAKSKKMLRN